jgi:transposase
VLSIGAQRIFLYEGAADMRKSFNGLGALVESVFEGQLLTGSYFVFVNRRQTLVKILYWDADGFAVWSKRLSQGMFKLRKGMKNEITKRDLTLLLEGIEPKRMNRRFNLNN